MSLKTEIRQFAVENANGEKVRVNKAVKVQFLRLHPATARALAIENGIEVGKRGRIKAETFAAVAELV